MGLDDNVFQYFSQLQEKEATNKQTKQKFDPLLFEYCFPLRLLL